MYQTETGTGRRRRSGSHTVVRAETGERVRADVGAASAELWSLPFGNMIVVAPARLHSILNYSRQSGIRARGRVEVRYRLIAVVLGHKVVLGVDEGVTGQGGVGMTVAGLSHVLRVRLCHGQDEIERVIGGSW
jgi:hypothetical protein